MMDGKNVVQIWSVVQSTYPTADLIFNTGIQPPFGSERKSSTEPLSPVAPLLVQVPCFASAAIWSSLYLCTSLRLLLLKSQLKTYFHLFWFLSHFITVPLIVYLYELALQSILGCSLQKKHYVKCIIPLY